MVNLFIDRLYMLWYIIDIKYMDIIIYDYVGGI